MPDPQLIPCANCGATNRVPMAKMAGGSTPICGKCKAPLSLAVHPITVTDANFSAEVEHATLPVLLDMWAPWCGPCRMIAPIVDELAAEMAGKIRVGKLNVDENPAISDRFNVRGIPALLILKNGREIDRIVGVQPKAEIVKRIGRALA